MLQLKNEETASLVFFWDKKNVNKTIGRVMLKSEMNPDALVKYKLSIHIGLVGVNTIQGY